MIRNSSCGLSLVLALLCGAALPAIAYDGKAPQAFVVMAADAPPAAASATPKPGSEFKDCDKCPPMVVVPPGRFVMGSPDSEPGHVATEGPQHVVTIDRAFAVGKFEITFDDWEACVAERRCARLDDSGFGRGQRPVINVSYEDVALYTAWLSEKTSRKYRLLTEAEWEYAARAGSDKSRFWGNSPDQACQYANVFTQATITKYKDADRAVFRCDDGYIETAPVGRFKPNRFGLYDMLGNVWEWVEDCWNASYAGAPGDGSAWSTGECFKRVIRGGGWYYGPRNVRLAKRLQTAPTKRSHDLGFRVARSLP
jgi:formylglycine-generating enzyme required for sulfatase activity